MSHKKTELSMEMVSKAIRLDKLTLGVGIDGERAKKSPEPSTG